MKRHVLLYGILGGILIVLLRWMEYRFLVIDHSVEIYAALIALIFAVLGVWLGVKITCPSPLQPEVKFIANDERRGDMGLTPREQEILELIAQGLSNREIAEKLFVSQNTVKTHSSRVFAKLGAKRRTQAVQLGKELRLLP